MMRRQYQHRLPELKVMKNLLVQASVWIGQSPAVVSGNHLLPAFMPRSLPGHQGG